jgi:hypothetical protein
MPSLVFASAPGGSAFMEELLEVVARAVRDAGGDARTHVGPLPEADADTIYVIVPHEYLVTLPEHARPRPDQLRRTIGFNVEHPGTGTFETAAGLAPRLGGMVDINDDSTAELRRRGIKARRYVLGYTPLWDAWGGDLDAPRPLDVTYLGTAEQRRSAVLARAMRSLGDRSVRLLTPPHEPMTKDRPDFLMGTAKHEHLARTRVLLNLHRENSHALEWVRVLEAACNGCVVVTESSRGVAPFVVGEHLVMARPSVVGPVAAAVLADESFERRVREQAYRFVKEELDMTPSARGLVELASDLLERTSRPVRGTPPSLEPVVAVGEQPMAVDTPVYDFAIHPDRAGHQPTASAASTAAALAESMLAARHQDGIHWEPSSMPLAAADATRVSDVDVVLVRGPRHPWPQALVDDLAMGSVVPGRVLACFDGAPSGGLPAPYGRLIHPVAAGTGWSRNQLLSRSAAEWVLVLSADMRATPELVEQLLAAANDGAEVAHSPIADRVHGLVGALPAEARRLAALPYLGAGYLVRRSLIDGLGGWSTDPWCEGLADHLFWQAAVAAGARTTLVQNVLLSRDGEPRGGRPIDLDPARAWRHAKA